MDVLLVDGYNLLFGDIRFAGALRVGLDEGRFQLVRFLESWCPLEWDEIRVYFDAAKSRGGPPEPSEGPIIVEFTSKSADSAIERYVYQHGSTMRLSVVTNDRALRQMVRGKDAIALTIEDFESIAQRNGAV